jgi:hypothetical protein
MCHRTTDTSWATRESHPNERHKSRRQRGKNNTCEHRGAHVLQFTHMVEKGEGSAWHFRHLQSLRFVQKDDERRRTCVFMLHQSGGVRWDDTT